MTFRSFVRVGFVVPCVAMTLAAAAGCDGRTADEDPNEGENGVTVWDSAGIEIVENHAPEHPAGSFWSIDVEPEIVLGGSRTGARDGAPGGAVADSAHTIWQVRGLARLLDGRVAVLSMGNHRLFLFEPSGELSRVIGGRG